MEATTPTAPVSKSARVTGYVLSTLPVLMLLMSGVMKIAQTAEVVKGFADWPPGSAVAIGILELACTVVYLVPRTAVLGAILLTGYLGGATAVSMRLGVSFVLPVAFGVLVWGGLYLRDPRLRALIPLRR
ncbi:MAG TPA: DoxX family protein [Lacunisphaera sp.]|nr:DoxX family protein [Lacunisphaera sp.]